MYHLNNRYKKIGKLSEKSSIILLISSIIVLFIGIFGLIEHKPPHNLASISTLSLSFFLYIEYHIMIVLGAFGSVFSTWTIQNS